jgi:hypothetical protein
VADTDTATTAPPAAQDAPEGAAPTDDTAPARNAAENDVPAEGVDADAGDGETKGRAAQYRRRAQEAETRAAELEEQITGHTATIERLQRLHVDRAISDTGLKPAAVYAVAQLADLLGDDGLPDQSKLEAAVQAAKEQLGAAPPSPPLRREMGMRSGAAGHPRPKRDGWAGAFAPRED